MRGAILKVSLPRDKGILVKETRPGRESVLHAPVLPNDLGHELSLDWLQNVACCYFQGVVLVNLICGYCQEISAWLKHVQDFH